MAVDFQEELERLIEHRELGLFCVADLNLDELLLIQVKVALGTTLSEWHHVRSEEATCLRCCLEH